MSSEEIIEQLGPFGFWQRVIFFTLCFPDIFVAMSILLPVFTAAVPRMVCQTDNRNVTNNLDIVGNITPTSNDGMINDSCSCSGRDFVDDFTSIVSQWVLVCDQRYVSYLITSIQMSGLLVGAAIFGQLSDLFGRKKTYFTTVALLSVSGLVSAFSVSWQMYAVFRFCVGVSAGGYLCINCVYPLEFVGQRWRTLCGTLGYWALGEMILALIAYFVRDWRYLTLCSSTCGFLFFAAWWILPESPRWLVGQGQLEAAKNVYLTIAKRNSIPAPDLSSLDQDQAEDVGLEDKLYTYLDLFRSWRLAKITLITVSIWFTTFVVYYETSFNLTHLSGNRYLNMFFAGFLDLGAMLSVILLNNVLGRRISQVLYVGVAAACNISILAIYASSSEGLETGIKVSALIGKASALAGTYVVQIWSAELYPTQVSFDTMYFRNAGIGLGSVFCRLGSFISPQIVFLGDTYKLAPYIVIVVLCLIVLPLSFLLEETNGKPLLDHVIATSLSVESGGGKAGHNDVNKQPDEYGQGSEDRAAEDKVGAVEFSNPADDVTKL